jgi:hypothetical protein
MQQLQARCRSLLLLTATPMQVHPVELWDLMDLLGLPDDWRRDDHVFLRYFQRASGNPSPDDLEYLASLFRATEASFSEIAERETARILPEVSALKRKKILRALRDVSAIPRKTMDSDTRHAATRLLQATTPLRHRMVRNTRELLRRYNLPVPKRDPREVVVDLLIHNGRIATQDDRRSIAQAAAIHDANSSPSEVIARSWRTAASEPRS